MKHFLKSIAVFTAVLSLIGVPGLMAQGEPLKVAYVDVAKIFDGYQKTKDNDRVLQEAGKKKEGERDSMVHEIRQMKDELALLKEDARAKKQEVLEGKLRQLAQFDQGAKQTLGEARNKVVREIFKDIDDEVQKFGTAKGYDYIFNERSFVFHKNQYDVTNEILAEINKSYAAKKK